MSRIAILAAYGCFVVLIGVAKAQMPPVATFAAAPRISWASISLDGRYLATIANLNDVQTLLTQDRMATGAAALHNVLNVGRGSQLSWCPWVSDTRMLCGLRSPARVRDTMVFNTRLIGVNADGSNSKALLEDQDVAGVSFLSRIIAWEIPGQSGTVLVQALLAQPLKEWLNLQARNIDYEKLPAVYALDTINGGDLKGLFAPRVPLLHFLADSTGKVMGWGPLSGGETEYDVRDPRSHEWRKAASLPGDLQPVALCAAALNCAYALGDSGGRKALLRIDLSGTDTVAIEFSHPTADLETPLLARDGHLLGVRYDTIEPQVYYTDAMAAAVIEKLKTLLPDQFLTLKSFTRDGGQLIVKASSDTDPGSFYLYDRSKNKLVLLGVPYPDLRADRIGHMRPISVVAQDGTTIPGYLTLPPGGATRNLPLIALPHGGLVAHDTREFNLLRAFLVSRGYAVLQVNYRGSSGLGSKWLADSHGDWGGLPYSDVADSVRWAIKQGIAAENRVCIVGSDYGGYLALLGAERNPDLFRCAVSIGGYADFAFRVPGIALDRHSVDGAGIANVSSDYGGVESAAGRPAVPGPSNIRPGIETLRAESPRQHAAAINVPVLLVHGDQDAMVPVEQSEAMDAALTAAHKEHQLLLLRGGDHDLSSVKDRTKMLTTLEAFLAVNLH